MLRAMLLCLGFVGLTWTLAQGVEKPPPGSPANTNAGQGQPPGPPPAMPPGPPPGMPPGMAPGPPAPMGGPQAGTPPALKYVAPGVFEIGMCKITKAAAKVEFPAAVNMKEGMLEYLLVGNSGKLHESLLRTDVEPYALQIALLLTGLEGSLAPLGFQGENKLPEGDSVDITLKWQENGKDKTARIEELILQGNKPVEAIPWVFTGSMVNDGVFAAQSEKSIIAVFHDPVAMFDHRLASGASDEVWTVNPQAAPAPGTPLTVTITKKSQPAKAK